MLFELRSNSGYRLVKGHKWNYLSPPPLELNSPTFYFLWGCFPETLLEQPVENVRAFLVTPSLFGTGTDKTRGG